MKKLIFAVCVLGLFPARAGDKAQIWEMKVKAKSCNWQYDPRIVVNHGQIARITASGTWSVVRTHGPEGNEQKANSMFLEPGAREGALLIKDGVGTVHAFKDTGQELVINNPGVIMFAPNDQIKGTNSKHRGCSDNSGEVKARIFIK
jgi:hypothetical protein